MTAHVAGWAAKMVVSGIGDCFLASLAFELLEVTSAGLFKFVECWWNSLFIDFLGAI